MPARSAAPRLLIVTAVLAERDAAAAELISAESVLGPYATRTATTPCGRVDLIAGGVGPAAAAAATATALASANYDLVLSVGIGGGFAPLKLGSTVVAAAIVQADLGAESPDGFIPATDLGLGATRIELPDPLVRELTTRCGATTGAIITVSTVTGSAATTAELQARYPDAVAEGMEGAGVLTAALAHRVPFGEVRTISNRIGPRDRDAWELGPALAALGRAVGAITGAPLPLLPPEPVATVVG